MMACSTTAEMAPSLPPKNELFEDDELEDEEVSFEATDGGGGLLGGGGGEGGRSPR